MTFVRRHAGCLLLVMLAACSEPPAVPPGTIAVAETDSAGVTRVMISGDIANLPVWGLSTEPVLQIRGEDPPHLGSIGEVQLLSDGRLLVEDNQTDVLRLFNTSGVEERVVGG